MMVLNYLASALRSLKRDRLYTALNVAGLTLGVGCCLILGLYISNEASYDRHHVNGDRLYRVVNELALSGVGDPSAWSSRSLGPLLQLDYPESIQAYTRFKALGSGGRSLIRTSTSAEYWDKVFYTDPNVFRLFSHTIIAGDPETALLDPNSIAVSESFAAAYFDSNDPVGQIVTLGSTDFEVTLVFENLPQNSHLRYDALFPMSALGEFPQDEAGLMRNLTDLSLYTYVLITPETDSIELDDLLNAFIDARMLPLVESFGLTNFSIRFWAENVVDIHYHSDVGMDEPTGNLFYLFSYFAVAIFILLVACINYVNLATSQFVSRGKEVGIRKTIGAARSQLFSQFVCEAVAYVMVSGLFALLVSAFLLEYGLLDGLLGQRFDSAALFELPVIVSIATLCFLVGIFSGIYPAIYLTSVSPKAALTSHRGSVGIRRGLLRQFLVLVQFTVSIAIIACTLIMVAQIRYLSELSLGFEEDNRMLVDLHGAEIIEAFPNLRNELLSQPEVLDVAITQHLPGSDLGFYGLNLETEQGSFELRSTSLMEVGNNFVEVLGITIAEGRSLIDPSPAGPGQNLLVNQVLVDQMQWQKPIGKQVRGFMGGTVVGVVEDFNLESLHQPIGPVILRLDSAEFLGASFDERSSANKVMVIHLSDKISGENLDRIRAVFEPFDPLNPFEFEYLDVRLDQLYASEQATTRLTSIFAGICIFISCLGLFGLSAFNAEQRTKEFGIRKVLGATGLQLFWLLVRNIILLIGVSSVVAAFASWLAMSRWLEGFAYSGGVSPASLVMAVLTVFVVALVTVGIQSAKTTRSNPIDSLKFE